MLTLRIHTPQEENFRLSIFPPRPSFHGRLLFGLICWLLVGCAASAYGVSCSVAVAHPPSEAESAFLKSDFDKAVALYRDQVKQHPDDVLAASGLVDALLRQQKVAEASDVVKRSIESQPKSSVLLAAKAEVLYRQGTPWLAAEVVEAAAKDDPCNARLRLMRAKICRLNSLYATELSQVRVAHQLDPYDPAIRRAWLNTLPTKERIAELEAYLAAPHGDDPEDLRHWKTYLETLKKRQAEPRKSCRLVSDTKSTEIPFAMLMRDATHVRAFGLEVKLNERKSRLEIDTGAGGILVSRSVAEHAGLKPFVDSEVGGIGSQGEKKAYLAYADSIKIGSLEFHDCIVDVVDSRNVVGESDGLIGMDVLSSFLVTLDYPMRKLVLGPLPPRPTETGAAPSPTLQTAGEKPEDDEEAQEAGTKNSATAASPNDLPAKAAVKSIARGPYDRYVAPEMKDYIKIMRIGHQLLMPTNINNPASPPKLFIMDTGAFSTVISPEAAREVTKLQGDARANIQGLNGKVEKVYTAQDLTFYFAGFAQPGREVYSFDTSKISKNLGIEVSGLLGATTLSQLTIHIDYRDGLVKFDYDRYRGYRSINIP
jgi:predicted aspartyl protease